MWGTCEHDLEHRPDPRASRITVAGIRPTYTIQNSAVSLTWVTPSQAMPPDSEPLRIMMLSSVMS